MSYREVLEHAYALAKQPMQEQKGFSMKIDEALGVIVENVENSKAVFTVLVTSLAQKIVDPTQDVRRHQKQIPGGYSGRHVDTKFITPFLKDVNFPSMVESGWLTRSLEQPHPYDANYPGKIRGENVKSAFLYLLSEVENQPSIAPLLLASLFRKTYLYVESNDVPITRANDNGTAVRRELVLSAFLEHFKRNYGATHGAARLPVLAIYSCLQAMVEEETLSPSLRPRTLGSHTSPDFRSGALGDIELEDASGNVRIAVEVKHEIKVSFELVRTSGTKVRGLPVEQLHIVSSGAILEKDKEQINSYTDKMFQDFGCDLLIFQTHVYLLNLLTQILNPIVALDHYARNLENDPVIQKVHKEAWNQILEGLY